MSGCANELLTKLACKLDKKLHPIKSFLFGYDVVGDMIGSQCYDYEVLRNGMKVLLYSKKPLNYRQREAIQEVLREIDIKA